MIRARREHANYQQFSFHVSRGGGQRRAECSICLAARGHTGRRSRDAAVRSEIPQGAAVHATRCGQDGRAPLKSGEHASSVIEPARHLRWDGRLD
jgi:hypothetical protein